MSATAATASVVQFPHPGPEHAPPPGPVMPWNTGNHRRKFLCAPGEWLDGTDTRHRGTMSFWGEWEVQSRVMQEFPPAPGLPQYLHEALPPDNPPTGFRQNTDPWVFGSTFFYSNCKQLTPQHNPSALQQLRRGSVILFGSSIHGQFCLDTVFVVADATRFNLFDTDHLDVPDNYRTGTLESLLTTRKADPHLIELTLFRGATVDVPVEGMFSFVPALAGGSADIRFARPAYDDRQVAHYGFVNHASKQAPSGAKKLRPLAEVKQAWDAAHDSVLSAGLLLGTSIALPS